MRMQQNGMAGNAMATVYQRERDADHPTNESIAGFVELIIRERDRSG